MGATIEPIDSADPSKNIFQYTLLIMVLKNHRVYGG